MSSIDNDASPVPSSSPEPLLSTEQYNAVATSSPNETNDIEMTTTYAPIATTPLPAAVSLPAVVIHVPSSLISFAVPAAAASSSTIRRLSSASSFASSDDEEVHLSESPPPIVYSPSPMTDASFFERITWSWMSKFLALGASKTLAETDMYALLEDDQAEVLLNGMHRSMERVRVEQVASIANINDAEKMKQCASSSSSSSASTPSLRPRVNIWRALYYQFGRRYFWANMLLFSYTFFKLVQPLMLFQIVSFISDPSEAAWHGYLYAIAMGLGALGQALTHHQYFFFVARLGIDVRIALNGLIYAKALKLKTSHMMKTTTGQVVNLVSNDSSKSEDSSTFMPFLWNAPLEVVIVLALLYQQIGVAAFAGFAAILLMMPLQFTFSRLFSDYRRYTVARTDLRVKTINEILIGADVMKMMGWESSLEAKVTQVRQEEFESISRAARLKAINQAVFFSSMSVVSLVCFFTMHFRGVQFTPANVFTTISFFNMIKFPITNYIPYAVERVSEAIVAFRRIATFLELDDDVDTDNVSHRNIQKDVLDRNAELKAEADALSSVMGTLTKHKFSKGSVNMSDASFVWELTDDHTAIVAATVAPAIASPSVDAIDSDEILITDHASVNNASTSAPPLPLLASAPRQGLRSLSLAIPSGSLVGIIGSIGSYKSSFLSALLGEMTQVSGSIYVPGDVAYASQSAWIFAGSVRENILFGRPMNVRKYNQTIKACQLVDDIASFGQGDQTMIGEKGVNLSGGQRSRLSCARAVYGDCDLYLFDDPLAALDSLVARQLYSDVLGPTGLLAGRTRIIVTHQTHLLTDAYIVMLNGGRIDAQGSFNDLIAQGFLTEKQKVAEVDNDSSQAETKAHKKKEEARARRRLKRIEAMSSKNLLADKRSTAVPGYTSLTSVAAASSASNILVSESSAVGELDPRIFLKLFRAGGGSLHALMVVFLIIGGQAIQIVADSWLASWSGQSRADQANDYNAWVFIGLVGATIILGVTRAMMFFRFLLAAAKSVHSKMFSAVIYSPMRFFESNPVGRILNRFAKDQSIVDELLPLTFFDFTQCFFMVLGSLVVVGISAPIVLVVLVPIIPLFLYVRQRFLSSSRELKRMDSTTRSPVYAAFSSTLAGLMVIRSFKREEVFVKGFLEKIDDNTRCFIKLQMASRWFGLRLDAIASLVVLALCIIIVATRSSISAANAGFALSYCLLLTALFQWAVRQSAEVETMMTSVERIVEYGELKPEGARINDDCRPPPGWPAKGRVEFKDYQMRYRQGLDLVLKGVNVMIEPGEKVGVCGRTGAGKSSLFQSVLRLVEAAGGAIVIDGIPVASLGLSDLRSALSIIPQTPVIFSGTLRYNLDPFDLSTDIAVWSALDAVQLGPMVRSLKSGLLSVMAEFGSNFSVGECQLICVARALLKPSKILLVDEATANVDSKTDELIQAVIRKNFADRTVITIAHRLNTILDSDKIIVMSSGVVAEVGSPAELMARPPADLVANPDAKVGLFAAMASAKKGH